MLEELSDSGFEADDLEGVWGEREDYKWGLLEGWIALQCLYIDGE